MVCLAFCQVTFSNYKLLLLIEVYDKTISVSYHETSHWRANWPTAEELGLLVRGQLPVPIMPNVPKPS